MANHSPEGTFSAEENGNRWDQIDLGLLLAIVVCLSNNGLSTRAKIILAMVINMTISSGDTISDICIAIFLFTEGFWKWGIAVIVVDYVPGWVVLLSNIKLKPWKNVRITRGTIAMILISLISPISTPFFQLRWLCKFNCKSTSTFNHAHFNARLGELVSAVFESPLQIVLLLVMYAKGILPVPWNTDSTIRDSLGNELNLGPVPGVFSMSLSLISVLKGSIAISEATCPGEKLAVCVYTLCTIIFRTLSFTLFIIYFNEWSVLIVVIVMLATIVVIIRFDKDKKVDVSMLTTVLISVFMPTAVAKRPEAKQRKSNANKRDKNAENRIILTRKISSITAPLIILFDILLLVILEYLPEYRIACDIVLPKHTSILLLTFFLVPIGAFSFIAGLSIQEGKLFKRHYFGFILSASVLVISSTTVITFQVSGT